MASCVEPFEGEEFLNSFEDVLVVNGTLTNQLKNQEVVLTRSFRFDEDEIPNEEGAQAKRPERTAEEDSVKIAIRNKIRSRYCYCISYF